MLSAIGEILETPYAPPSSTPPPTPSTFSSEVTGIIFSSRKSFYRISIWTRSSDSRERLEGIGKQLKYGILDMREGAKKGASGGKSINTGVEFESHADTQKGGGEKKVWTVE
jgi:translation initiation factor 4E